MTAPPVPLVHHEHPARWAQDTTPLPLPRRPEDEPPTGRAVLHGTFACPWSYLASQRTDLIPDPSRRPAWQMVDPDDPPGTRLSAPGRRPDPHAAEQAAAELEAVRVLLLPGEWLPARLPAFVPRTGPAVVAYAEAVGAGAGAGDQVRRVLFDAYWQQGLDIGLPDVLRRLLQAPLRAGTSTVRCIHDHGYAVTLTGGPITTDAHLRARAWHNSQPGTLYGRSLAFTTDAWTESGPTALAQLAKRLDPSPQLSVANTAGRSRTMLALLHQQRSTPRGQSGTRTSTEIGVRTGTAAALRTTDAAAAPRRAQRPFREDQSSHRDGGPQRERLLAR